MHVTADPKQRGRWLLHEAREQIALGNFDAAEKKVAEAEALDVKWGLFDDTPAKVRNDLIKERPKTVAAASKPASTQPGDRKAAKAKLREARTALANHQYEQAESIAQEVKGWNLNYGLFEDNPDKVAAAARALRKRDKIRNTTPREQASQGVYDVLVQESRQLMKLGKLDEAEAKARQAQRMNVVPALTADRAESVLHDIAMARAQTTPAGTPTAAPAAEPASVVAEREANDLLAKGDQAKAAAKFAEAERLRTSEAGTGAVAQAAARPALDAAVQKVASDEPAGEPLLAPSGGDAPQRTAAAATPGPAPVDLTPATPPAEEPNKAAPVALAPAETGKDDAPLALAPSDEPKAAASADAPKAAVAGPGPGPGGQPRAADARRGQGPLHQRQLPGRRGSSPRRPRPASSASIAQADELLAQIGLAEQGGALSLYESALSAMRNGENDRARALLTEVAAAGGSLDESLQAKVQDLLEKLPADDKAGAQGQGGRRRQEPR